MAKDELSQIRANLPVTPGINGREDYLNSAVLVLLMKHEGTYHFIFEKRSPKIRQGGEICFPGGKFDPDLDQTTQGTALRETFEEVGISSTQINVLGALDFVIAPIGVIVEPFLGVIDYIDLKQLKINHDEVERIFTLPLSFFKNNPPKIYQTQVKVHPSYVDEDGKEMMLFPGKALGIGDHYTKPWGHGKNTIFVYTTDQGIIWGLTARIIYDIVEKL